MPWFAIAAGSPGGASVGVGLGLPDNFREYKVTRGDIVFVGVDRKKLEKIGDLDPLAMEVVVAIEGDPGMEG